VTRAWRWPLAGFVLGSLVGATVLTVNVVGASSPGRLEAASASVGDVLHTPPLLVQAGEPVELTYDVVCAPQADESEGGCAPEGSVFVRGVGETDFEELALAREPEGRLSVDIPPGRTDGAGFEYYARIDTGVGEPAIVPAGAGDAPQRVWTLERSTAVDFGVHRFGETEAPSSTLDELAWGKGRRMLGLDSGREQSRIGPSAFDMGPDGSAILLDQVNDRLMVTRANADPRVLPIEFAGGEGDLAVGNDGAIYVLDAGGAGADPVVRSYAPSGDLIAGTPLAEPVADMIRAGPDGPLVHAYPSEMWLPTGPSRPPLAPEDQVVAARAGRTVAGGLAVVVRASPVEAKLALVRGDRVANSWVVRSSTTLGEVQLAEPYGEGMLVVLRLWTETQAEFRVLRLTPDGLAGSFAVDGAEWAETASLSRFRLHGSTLYQLRSTPSGVEIAAFEIGGTR
jgi:hypothetical protein